MELVFLSQIETDIKNIKNCETILYKFDNSDTLLIKKTEKIFEATLTVNDFNEVKKIKNKVNQYFNQFHGDTLKIHFYTKITGPVSFLGKSHFL